MKKQFLLIGSLLCSSMVFGQAYQLNVQGIRQQAMGGTGAAIPWDASTVFYNPAGMDAMETPQVYASMNLMMPRTRYISAPTGTSMMNAEEQNFTPYNVYFVSPIGYKTPLSIGMGIYTPFGYGIKWDDNWTGRYLVQEMNLRTTFFQPTLAWAITDDIKLGAGFIYARGSYDYRKALPWTDVNGNDATQELTGNATGVGYNIGLHLRASDKVQFGITYRSRVNMNINAGYAKFTSPGLLSSQYVNTAFETQLPMPQVATVAMGWNAGENTKLQFEASYTGWGAYDSLRFDYENNTTLLQDEASARRYRNSITLRAGLHQTLKNDRWVIMLGAAYIPSPVVEGTLHPEMPDAKHFLGTGGLSFQMSKRITLMGSVQYTFGEVRTGRSYEHNFTGKYLTKNLNAGVGIVYDFN